MKWFSRPVLASALVLFLLSSACRWVTGALPTPTGTVLPAGQISASATPGSLSVAPLIPITGENGVSMQCQFCVGEETHAILTFPEYAYFDVEQSAPVTCLTADIVNGRRVVICRGPQSVSFNLKICSDSSNCLQFPVALLPCALLQGRPAAPVFLTPLVPEKDDEPAYPTATQEVVSPPTPGPPPVIVDPPQPTKEPKPTREPKPTKIPKPTRPPKPTKSKP